MVMKYGWSAISACIVVAGSVCVTAPAIGAEGGTGFYLLGSKTTMGGFLPPPGVYGAVQNYFYSGSADIDFKTAGVTLEGGVDAFAYVAIPTGLLVLDTDILGADLAFSLSTPFGAKDVEVGAIVDTFLGTVSLDAERDNFAFGDPVVGASLGWHAGMMHYSLGSVVNVPIGQWKRGSPVNLGFNRWVIDTTAAATYLNPETGFEMSGAVGITYNFENEDTDYKTGTELHIEGAIMQHFSPTFSAGLNGYVYKQLTEPHWVCRRAQLLRRKSHHEQNDEQVFPRSA
jgi:hypothetical protein